MTVSAFRLMILFAVATSLSVTLLIALRPADPRAALGFTRVTNESALWLLDLDTSKAHRLLQEPHGIAPLWSPDGRWLAYRHSASPDSAPVVNLVDLFTGTSRVLPANGELDLFPVSWSPDSRWLILNSASRDALYAVTPVSARDSPPHALGGGSIDMLWSPDSSRLYFRNRQGTVVSLSVRCLEQRLRCVPTPSSTPVPINRLIGWIPATQTLMAAAARPADGAEGLFEVDPVSGEMAPFAFDPPSETQPEITGNLLPGAPPVWSPDGSLLALSLAVPGSPSPASVNQPIAGLYTLDRDGNRTLVWAGIAGQLTWSPDSRLLAFELVSNVSGDRAIWTYEPATGALVNRTRSGAIETNPAWVAYRGRRFAPGVVLLLDTLLVAALRLGNRLFYAASNRRQRGA